MTHLLSLLAMTIVLYGLDMLIREYNVLVLTRFRFRYEALRDELAMRVVRGQLAEDSWAYRHIVAAINHHLHALETMSTTEVLRRLIAYHTSADAGTTAAGLVEHGDDPAIKRLLVRYVVITQDLLLRVGRCQIALAKLTRRPLAPAARKRSPEIFCDLVEALNAIEQSQSRLCGQARA